MEEMEEEDEEVEVEDMAVVLGSKMAPGKYHWTDERFPDGIIQIKLHEEVEEIEDMEELEGVTPFDEDPPTMPFTIYTALLVDLGGRKIHAVCFGVDPEGRPADDEPEWTSHDIPSHWVTALKKVKWPEPWDYPDLRYQFPVNSGVIVENTLENYPLDFSVTHRF
jgi:hypothetical protein